MEWASRRSFGMAYVRLFTFRRSLCRELADLADSLNDEDVREQVIQVFDSATGTLLMSTAASPILTAGQNFALSDDGQHLAVLHDGAIEIYKVPPPPPKENPELQASKKK